MKKILFTLIFSMVCCSAFAVSMSDIIDNWTMIKGEAAVANEDKALFMVSKVPDLSELILTVAHPDVFIENHSYVLVQIDSNKPDVFSVFNQGEDTISFIAKPTMLKKLNEGHALRVQVGREDFEFTLEGIDKIIYQILYRGKDGT